jgi:hypothetical protein
MDPSKPNSPAGAATTHGALVGGRTKCASLPLPGRWILTVKGPELMAVCRTR